MGCSAYIRQLPDNRLLSTYTANGTSGLADTFTVPDGVGSFSVTAYGASGGNTPAYYPYGPGEGSIPGFSGGSGGEVTGTLTVHFATYQINAGGAGSNSDNSAFSSGEGL